MEIAVVLFALRPNRELRFSDAAFWGHLAGLEERQEAFVLIEYFFDVGYK